MPAIYGYMFVIMLICGALLLVIRLAEESSEEKRKSKEKAALNELEPLCDELLKEKKIQYDQYYNKSDYERGNYPIIKTEDWIPLCFGDMNPNDKCLQEYDIWKNNNNFCIMSSWEGLQERARILMRNKSSYLVDSSSIDQRKSDFRRDMVEKEFMKIHAFSIPLNDIEYFAMSGQKYTTTEISGGGGNIGGTSIPGAIVGGMVAGETGAVIGSRKKGTIEPVKSYTSVHDERDCYIKFKKEDGTLDEVVCKHNDRYVESRKQLVNAAELFYDSLKKVIPEKEYAYILASTNIQEDTQVEANDIEERLLQAKNLLDKGLITQEEYEAKREDILKDM